MWDDLLINGTSLTTIGVIENFSGIAKSAPLRGDDLTIPGLAGSVFMPKVRAAYEFEVPLALALDAQGDRMQALHTLELLLDSSTTALTMTRRITRGVTQLSQTAQGTYLSGLEPAFFGSGAARVPLVLVNLSGGWT